MGYTGGLLQKTVGADEEVNCALMGVKEVSKMQELIHELNGVRYRSTDAGKTWEVIKDYEHVIEGKVYTSPDGINWERKRSPVEALVVKVVDHIIHGKNNSDDNGDEEPVKQRKSKTKAKSNKKSFAEKMSGPSPFDDGGPWSNGPFDD